MRQTRGTIEVSENIIVEKEIVKEDFSLLVINRKEKYIDVVIDKMTEDSVVIDTESYQFKEEYTNFPDENYLWSMIDKAREKKLNNNS